MSPEAFWATLSYLLSFYWPYMIGAMLVGVGAGWFTYSKREG